MIMIQSLAKRGSVVRYEFKGVNVKEVFELPKGFSLVEIAAKTISGTGNISLGTTEARRESALITLATGAITTSGNITVAGVAVAVVEDDTADEVVQKIETAFAANATWNVQAFTDLGPMVQFTAKVEGNLADVTFVDTGATGVSLDGAIVIVQGTVPEDVVAAVAAASVGEWKYLSPAKKDFQNGALVYLNSATADLVIDLNLVGVVF